MIKILLANKIGKILLNRIGLNGQSVLVVESLIKLDAHWQSSVNDAAETIDIVTPKSKESIMITDLIITSSKKVANSTLIIQFSDGVNTELLTEMEGETSPIEFSHAFSGGLKGWKDAVLQVVTDQALMNVTTLIGYVKISKTLTKTYSEWDVER